MLPTLSKKDAAKVKRLLQQYRPCVLCGRPPAVSGIFVPTKPEAWGGKPNKVRLLSYTLCRACFALPEQDRALAVEARLQAGVVGQRN